MFGRVTWRSIRDEWARLHPDWTDDQLDAKADDLYEDYQERIHGGY